MRLAFFRQRLDLIQDTIVAILIAKGRFFMRRGTEMMEGGAA
jgi:hypothetical protein